MTVLLGVSMGAHAVRMALPRNGSAVLSPARLLDAPQQLFFKNQVIDTVDDEVEYLAAESISAMAAESEPQMSTGVAYRDAHQADTLHRALEHQHLQNYHLVHEVEAVVEYLVASGEAAGHSTVALYDLGSSGLNVSVVDLDARRVIVTRRSTEFSGDLFDAILRDNQLARLGKPSDAPDIDLFTRRCRVAKERLSGNDAVCLPDESGMILLSRDSYETLITDEVNRSIEFARDVLISAHVPIDAVVLVGGGSRVPLVRDRVGPSLDLPALTPNEPESVAARGAALSARPTEVSTTVEARPVVEPALSEPALSGPAVSGPAVSGPAVSEPAVSAPAVSEPAVSAPALSQPAAPGSTDTATPRPTDATPTISISRADLQKNLPPLLSAGALATATQTAVRAPVADPAAPEKSSPESEQPTGSSVSGSTPDESAEASQHFALSNVYWMAADYEDDDGEDESERKRRLVRAWSITGVAAAAVIAVSGFLLTRPSSTPAVVDTAVTQAPAPSVAATTPPPTTTVNTPVAPVLPPPVITTEAPVEPEPEVVPQQRNTVPENTATQEEPAPQPTVVVPPPAPAPPPLIPGLPNFTLPTIPPLLPPAP